MIPLSIVDSPEPSIRTVLRQTGKWLVRTWQREPAIRTWPDLLRAAADRKILGWDTDATAELVRRLSSPTEPADPIELSGRRAAAIAACVAQYPDPPATRRRTADSSPVRFGSAAKHSVEVRFDPDTQTADASELFIVTAPAQGRDTTPVWVPDTEQAGALVELAAAPGTRKTVAARFRPDLAAVNGAPVYPVAADLAFTFVTEKFADGAVELVRLFQLDVQDRSNHTVPWLLRNAALTITVTLTMAAGRASRADLDWSFRYKTVKGRGQEDEGTLTVLCPSGLVVADAGTAEVFGLDA